MTKLSTVVLLLALMGAGCNITQPTQTRLLNKFDSETTDITTRQTVFASDLYYTEPFLDNFGSRLTGLTSGDTGIDVFSVGFDIRNNTLAYVVDNQVVLVTADGTETNVTVDGLYGLARPSLSPDGSRVAVQASTRAFDEITGPSATDLGIFVIDIAKGTFEQINQIDPTGQSESPEWFHNSNRIAYSSFSLENGVILHVYDLDSGSEVMSRLLTESGGLHLSVSPDDSLIFNSIDMRLYNADNGALMVELQDASIAGLRASGYAIDFDHNGFDVRDSYTLDGDFTPDGTAVVFDGAVINNGVNGLAIFQMDLDGSNFSVLRDVISVNPDFGNNNNFSQLNPLWVE